MSDKELQELKDLTFEIIRRGEATTFHDAYHKARQQCVGLRNYAAQWNLVVSAAFRNGLEGRLLHGSTK